MTTGADLIRRAETWLGEPYRQMNPGRYQADSGFKDCSGLIKAACDAESVEMPATVSVTQFLWCRDNGGIILPFDEAIWIAGAVGWCPENPLLGWGDNGHVGFFRGDGTTIEATPPRVQILSVHYQPWSRSQCALLPGVDYSNAGHGTPETEPVPVPVPVPEVLAHEGALEMDGIYNQGTYHWFLVDMRGQLVERWGNPNEPQQAVILKAGNKFGDGIPSKEGGKVSVVRGPGDTYGVAMLRADGEFTRAAFWDGSSWVKE